MNKFYTFYLFLFTLIFLSSCAKEKTDIIVNLTPDVRVSVREKFDQNGNNGIFLYFESIDNIPFQDATINYSVAQNNEKFVITLDSVKVPTDSLLCQCKATAWVEIEVQENGTLPIEIKTNEVISSNGFLTITDNDLNLSLEMNKGMQVFSPNIKRILPKTIWGTIQLEADEDEEIKTNFLKEFESFTKENFVYPAGEYGYFNVDGNGNVVAYRIDSCDNCTDFVFNFTQNPDEVKNLIFNFITLYRANFNDIATFKVYDSYGNVY